MPCSSITLNQKCQQILILIGMTYFNQIRMLVIVTHFSYKTLKNLNSELKCLLCQKACLVD